MTTPLQDRYVELLTVLGNHPADVATWLQARLNSAYKQYNMGLIAPEEFQRIIDKITTEIYVISH